MATLLHSIQDKYGADDADREEYGWIVFVSNSPECKKGMFPPIMTLSDYDISSIGHSGIISRNKLSHIAELDLTDNLMSEWSEICALLKMFPGLEFLNLSNNLLTPSAEFLLSVSSKMNHGLRKLVLHGNKVDWKTLHHLALGLPNLEEIHLSNNGLGNPDGSFRHENVRQLFLTCNEITSFDAVQDHLGAGCPRLELLSLGENPLTTIPCSTGGFNQLNSLNLNITKIKDWNDLDKLRKYPNLKELRVKHCPLLEEYTAHERRMMVIARLPNVLILNGGDKIPDNEREDAERAYIRFYMDEEEKPKRYHELVAVHGRLDPLVNFDMQPSYHVKVKVCHKEDSVREEVINLKQTVAQFKGLLHQWFSVPTQNMKLYYCDQVTVQHSGPEEMKWPNKALYTYNVQEGDKFILDEKVPLTKLRTNSGTSLSSSTSPKVYGSPGNYRTAVQFGLTPYRTGSSGQRPSAPTTPRSAASSGVSRNLFGSGGNGGGTTPSK
jgi:hypothetical protein